MENKKPQKGKKRKVILEAAHSSCLYWLFINGNMARPIKAISDANRHVLINVHKKGEKEWVYANADNYVVYSPHHILTFRPGGQHEETIGSYSPMVP